MKILLLLLILIIVSLNSFAHNVVGGVYVSGNDIEGEAGFSNGAMANQGTLVKVFDQSGVPLGEVITDDEGFFIFTAKKRITHVFQINMGAGHILKMQLPAEELPQSLGEAFVTNTLTETSAKLVTSINSTIELGTNQLTIMMIDKSIARQIKPLRKEIQALKEKSGFRDIIGGVGYIFGLLGLVAFLRERKLRGQK
jgi:nickel transport protein